MYKIPASLRSDSRSATLLGTTADLLRNRWRFHRNTHQEAHTPYLTVIEAAKMASLAPSTVRLYIRKGQLKALKVGRRVVVPRKELERFLSLNPTAVVVH